MKKKEEQKKKKKKMMMMMSKRKRRIRDRNWLDDLGGVLLSRSRNSALLLLSGLSVHG